VALLESRHVSKRFGGITALHDVSLEVDVGEAVGLVGPNGAGKTTLFNCLLGVLRPDAGTITFAGHDLARLAVWRRARLGISRTFQRMELFAGLTVEEHLLVTARVSQGGGGLVKDLLNRSEPTTEERVRTEAVLELLGIADLAPQPVESLSLGRGRLVELGRALVSRPRLLMLDEPSSGLDRVESLALAGVLRRVQEEEGTAVLLVEHDLEMVQRVVTRLYVLDFGELLASGAVGEVMVDAQVRKAYLGREAS
jgi:branched-chain amino acid transport system ATP-binding protein